MMRNTNDVNNGFPTENNGDPSAVIPGAAHHHIITNNTLGIPEVVSQQLKPKILTTNPSSIFPKS